MKYIKKNPSPEKFEQWKVYKKPSSWKELDGYPIAKEKRIANHVYYSKEELRQALIYIETSPTEPFKTSILCALNQLI